MQSSKRILSVDVFRGMTILLMILVNTPGTWNSIYAPFRHASWHGCTPTDLVFPFFLLIVGTSIVLAYKEPNNTNLRTYLKIFKRGIKLILLGLFLAGFLFEFPFFKAFNQLRLPGVLQRIGLVFVSVALLYHVLNQRALFVVFFLILIGYWYLMTQIPILGAPPLLTKTSNLAAYLDLKLFTQAHIWKPEYDPEGLLSTLPAIATGLMGVFLGLIIKSESKTQRNKLLIILGIGLSGLVLGRLWDFYFPINKALWTSSYVLYTGGIAFIIFGFIYYFMDVKDYTKWATPFIYFGTNPIAIYFLSSFIAKTFYITHLPNGQSPHAFLYSHFYTSWIHIPKLSSLLYALSVVLVYYLLAKFLYKKRLFIKV